jgi:hypothetical protein
MTAAVCCMLKSLESPFTQVAIIEDDRRTREGLEALINGTEGYRCTAAFRSREDALERPWPEVPEVVRSQNLIIPSNQELSLEAIRR